MGVVFEWFISWNPQVIGAAKINFDKDFLSSQAEPELCVIIKNDDDFFLFLLRLVAVVWALL